MKTKIRSPLAWLIVVLSSVALIGFAFTPALADESGATGDYEVIVPEGSVILDTFEGADVSAPEGDESFGRNYQSTWLAAQEFDPMDSGISYNRGPSGIGSFRCRTGGLNWFDAPIKLPSGARLYIARLFYLDNVAGSVLFFLHRTSVSESNGVAPSVTQVGPQLTSGSGYGNIGGTYSFTIANRYNIYNARVNLPTGGCVIGVRLFWQRQIRTGLSHPFVDIGGLSAEFQNSIAALYQSGITTGTSSITFSPNNPVTRGQFATFFARALGLHWAYNSGY
jgi:S-layer homology domain